MGQWSPSPADANTDQSMYMALAVVTLAITLPWLQLGSNNTIMVAAT